VQVVVPCVFRSLYTSFLLICLCCSSPHWDWTFPDAGQLPVPVLAIENVSFNYPGGKELYSKVDFGVDLQTRVALVGPNGGKSTCEL
jgi:ABC-type multidrug transport system fused ATPase/permease subunit